jgi:hypothetical protein
MTLKHAMDDLKSFLRFLVTSGSFSDHLWHVLMSFIHFEPFSELTGAPASQMYSSAHRTSREAPDHLFEVH